MNTNRETKNSLKVNSDIGLSLIGFLFAAALFIGVAFLALSIYPVINEKLKVDLTLESLATKPTVSTMSIQGIATAIEKAVMVYISL